MPSLPRIDVHQHIVPPVWAAAVATQDNDPGGWSVPAWGAGATISMMDEHHIDTGVLSISAPGVHFGDDTKARALARAANEQSAEYVKDRPDRFGLFASLPLPDVDGALAELAYAVDELEADGVVLTSSVRGRYLGDSAYAPLWDELDRRRTVVFVHPVKPQLPLLHGTIVSVLDFPADTTRTALDLVLSGVMRAHPELRVILAHAGGFVPYAAHRFAELTSTLQDSEHWSVDEVLEDLRRFYFETALSSSPTSLPSLLAFAEPGHVLYGSDWPYAPVAAGEYFNRSLDTYSGYRPGETVMIDRKVAEDLFPRLRGNE